MVKMNETEEKINDVLKCRYCITTTLSNIILISIRLCFTKKKIG